MARFAEHNDALPEALMIFAAILIFLSAFLISVAGTYLARRCARRLGLMDDPGHRKVHIVATPRNGGIGIFWGFALPLLVGLLALHLVVYQVLPDTARPSALLLKFELPTSIAPHVLGMREHGGRWMWEVRI
jgi:hypothetical protein